MIGTPLLLALTAGMVGAINPCGFSLLPAYVGFFVAGDDGQSSLDRRVLRAVSSSVSVTLGFVAVFVTLGVLLGSFADAIQDKLPWVAIVIGVVLVLAGLATVAGQQIPVPRLAFHAVKGRGRVAMISYGAVYAMASLSCTIGPFLAITTASLNRSLIGGLTTYVAYALGMGVVILAIAFAAALTRPQPVSRLRHLSRYASRLGGVLMVISGGYAVWYARWELSVYRGDLRSNSIVDVVERFRVSLVSWLETVGAMRMTVVVVGIVTITVLLARLRAPRDGLSS
ncbi:MAG: cytochrome c biogenesis protein CcdA [Actinomycetota bacterium]|nr:cytochrome c biogenesis protein CcdA [Actinomycetota bacterium]